MEIIKPGVFQLTTQEIINIVSQFDGIYGLEHWEKRFRIEDYINTNILFYEE